MTVIAMIWRPQPSRERAFTLATSFWAGQGDLMFFDSGHQLFNRAASRNAAFRWAEANGVERLVITDADTICEEAPLHEALSSADDSAVRLPYDRCRVFDQADNLLGEFSFTCGGVYVTTPAAWWGVGGQDERFTKWAPEDMAFNLAHETLVGPMGRHSGVLTSLGHAADVNRHDNSESDPLVQLYRQYEAANGDREAMRALCFR